ncbi:MAG: Rieske (2Fe-2S) protein [Tepidisphaerales bacterium]
MSLSRRQLLVSAAATSVALTVGGRTVVAAFAAQPFDAGVAADFPEGVTDTFARRHTVLIVRQGNTLYAMTAACPHKGTTLRAAGDQIRCPGHGSRFDLEGKATRGPAEGQLNRHSVTLRDGRLIVDPSVIFLPGDFDNPAARVTLPG